MKKSILISLSLMACLSASGQMTLQDCLLYAREHAYQNRINRLEIQKADADVRINVSNFMPSVSAYTNGNISFGRNIDPETNTYDNKKTLSTSFGVQLNLPLFDGLVNINNLKSAQAARKHTQMSAQVEEDDISLNVIKAFYQVSYCKAMVIQMKDQLERDSNVYKATVKGFELGTKSGADVAELKALVANDEFELLNQQNLLDKAYMSLRSSMGMEISGDSIALIEDSETIGTGIYQLHPKIAEAESQVNEYQYQLRAAKGAYSPTISFNSGVSTSYYKMMGTNAIYPSFSSQWKDNMGEWLGLSISIPIFNGLATPNRVRKASINLKQSKIRLEETKYQLERETKEAELDYFASSNELVAARKRLDAERIAYEAIRRKFELGGASAIDLYTSGTKLATAKATAEGKRIQKIINLITLNYCKGEKLIN